ncbi:MAG: hypothetical protein JXB19_04535 [Bacteroidales bacterium]|nr:hypothetical protein [Bacteroidales bacterium]
MKNEIEINERIDSYLKGILAEDEKMVFELRMQEDPSLARQVELHRQLHDVISDGVYLDLKNALKTIHLKKISTSGKIRRITGYGSGGLIIGLAVFLAIKNGTDNRNSFRESPVVPYRKTATDTLERAVAENDNPNAGTEVTVPSGDNILVLATDADALQPVTITQDAHGETGMTGTLSSSTDDADSTLIHRPIPVVEVPEYEPDQDGDLKSEEEMTIDCSQINIEAVFTSHSSCNNKPTGVIEIDAQSIKGGEPPYVFSLNQKTFADTLIFASLSPGSYPVYAKDAHDCANRLGIAIIDSEDCTYQDIFAPLKGEIWSVPVERDKAGTLLIYSKAGIVVYSIPVSGNDPVVWNGETVNGQMLPMGLYQFEIRYSDGTSFTGNVTIVR